MKICLICNKEFPCWVVIDGKNRNLNNRKYCLECSPFGDHNTIRKHSRNNFNYLVCKTELKDTQLKFCSRACKRVSISDSYKTQKVRGLERKKRLVLLKGGGCEKCNYSRNLAALDFHHRDPNDKSIRLDVRSLSNRYWTVCLEESKKCILLCTVCHREHHHPELNDWNT